ncbi:hypothetical protein ASD8599_00264 [Ascidiaceihabitans donghaensis]|uniref:CoA-binding domain-containing protein n=1 Tax=Ascidiaceihabitans donghaensis TaxID=1510460 RepID=A0A2R8B930_9RHOB|nr:acetate--CoA ligase family protein [Ascidiaceihabitans donghaensis]SPH19538.1 hypothetical protein ASD8599_00264 [Ascidiaceihabitans donghaensis]
MSDVSRLLRPKSIAVVGGGAWCAQIVLQCQQMGFSGDIWVVHPKGIEVHGIRAVPSLDDLPGCPDAVFLGVNRFLTIDLVAQLAGMGAAGAVCFASGFSEALAEDDAGADLQARLVKAAGAMPILGPNCYGFINAVDQALLWPDQHGCVPVDRGVAVLTQSSNIAINLTMQQRALPIAYMVACGNMAQTSQAQIAMALLDDPRVTVIGLHIEGFGDIAEWHALALKAASKGIPLLALKVGKSEQAQSATVSHTASLAGSDAGADALLRRFGIGRVHDVPTFLETLKLLHVAGPLDAPTLSSISCSGGEASLAADTAHGTSLSFPALQDDQKQALRSALGPMVALSNPLDYNTYVWRDTDAMTAAWLPMAADHIGLTLLIVDYPHTDATDWVCATDAAIAVREASGRPVAVVATLPELMPQDVAAQLMAAGVVPMNGLTEAIAAAQVAAALTDSVHEAPLPAGDDRDGALVSERDAKTMLQSFGVSVPQVFDTATGPEEHSGPFVVKGVGFAHKSEMDAVRLNVAKADLDAVAADIPGDDVLIEAMVTGAVAELLVGVVRDPAHGFVLTVGAGGVMTEILQDTQSLLIPSDAGTIKTALSRLKTFPLLTGFRGKPAADLDAVVAAIMGVQSFVVARHDRIEEVEINPLMCTSRAAIAADALIKISPERT